MCCAYCWAAPCGEVMGWEIGWAYPGCPIISPPPCPMTEPGGGGGGGGWVEKSRLFVLPPLPPIP